MKKFIFFLLIVGVAAGSAYVYRDKLPFPLTQQSLSPEIKQLRDMIALDPDNPDLHNNIGIAYFQEGRLRDALASFERVIQLDPQYAEAYYNLGAVYGNIGRHDDAIAQYENAIALQSGQADTLNNLGLALFQKGEDAAALNKFNEALRLNPLLTAARNNIALVHIKQGDFDAAIAELLDTIRAAPANPEAYYNLGAAYHKKGKIEHAVNAYKKTLELKPDFAMANYGLAKIYYEVEKNKDKALVYFRNYLSAFPNDREVRALVAQIKDSAFGGGQDLKQSAPSQGYVPAAPAAQPPPPDVPVINVPVPHATPAAQEQSGLQEREFDVNNDGKVDMWLYYDASNKPVKKKQDTNFDGTPDKEENL
ncbi:MAG TPA: tetratricopeptide repeat protein [bacterium]|nr:tetratricopeptide repeat protein [bacterium]